MFVGIGMYFVWPPVQNGIYALGGLVTGSGYAGTLIFGIIKRALIPFGLHHVFYMPFWQTGVGGSMEVAGQVVQEVRISSLPNWRIRRISHTSVQMQLDISQVNLYL